MEELGTNYMLRYYFKTYSNFSQLGNFHIYNIIGVFGLPLTYESNNRYICLISIQKIAWIPHINCMNSFLFYLSLFYSVFCSIGHSPSFVELICPQLVQKYKQQPRNHSYEQACKAKPIIPNIETIICIIITSSHLTYALTSQKQKIKNVSCTIQIG